MNIFKKALTQVFVGANLCCILLLWGCCLSTWISPSAHPTLSTIGLAFPIFLLVNLLFVFFWLIFRIRFVWIPLVGIACIASYVQDFCPIRIRMKDVPEEALKVLSYNVLGLTTQEKKDNLDSLIRNHNADIVCLQEMPPQWLGWKESLKLVEDMGYHASQQGEFVILTHFPIMEESFEKNKFTIPHRSMACLTSFEGDSLIIINNHLESYKLSEEEKSEYKNMIKEPEKDKVKTGSRMLIQRLPKANAVRGTQIDSMYQAIRHHENCRILMCGDFNDTPISYTYQKTLRLLDNTFRESGIGVGRSFNEKGFYVRIDHIFVSRDWTSHNTCILSEVKASDHYPIVTYLTKKVK